MSMGYLEPLVSTKNFKKRLLSSTQDKSDEANEFFGGAYKLNDPLGFVNSSLELVVS